MSGAVGAFALGLMVIVLLIAIFSLIVLAIIPLGRFLERRAQRRDNDDPPS